MDKLFECFAKLRNRQSLTSSDIAALQRANLASGQVGSVCAGLLLQDDTSRYRDLIGTIRSACHPIDLIVQATFCGQADVSSIGESPPWLRPWATALHKLLKEKRLGSGLIPTLVHDIVEKQVPRDVIGFLLMAICIKGMTKEDTCDLTMAMKNSGSEYDYRNREDLEFRKVVRRYPTGALSEKVALILPSLLATIAEDWPIVSPFTVARSLGFTGGTWDKLSAIPAFRFPEPGQETVEVLRECHAAMTVTKGDFNPADNILYQLRSITGTVESEDLIISSIVSKQLAVPADRLILDVRYGPGAFLETRHCAEHIAQQMCVLLRDGGVPSLYTLIDTFEPNGMAIGNVYEVVEAICLIKDDNGGLWDQRALHEQKLLVVDFAVKLMLAEFSGRTPAEWARYCYSKFAGGDVWRSFRKLLLGHGVEEKTVEAIERDSFWLLKDRAPQSLKAKTDGKVKEIDQKALGNIVNFELGGGGNEFAYKKDLYSGVILQVRTGDPVRAGQEIMKIYAGDKLDVDTLNRLGDTISLIN